MADHFFAGKAMGIHEGVDYNLGKKSNKLIEDNENYKFREQEEKLNMLNKTNNMKNKVGVGNMNFSFNNKNKNTHRGGIMSGVNNVKDLLSSKPSTHTNKAKSLLSLNSTSPSKNKVFDVNKFLPGNNKTSAKSMDVSKFLPGNKSGKKQTTNMSKFLSVSKPGKKQTTNVSKFLPKNKNSKSVDIRNLVNSAKRGTNMSSIMGKYSKLSNTANLDMFKANKTINQYSGLGKKPFGDFDGDGVRNIMDCRPKDKKKQGFFDVTTKQNQSISGPEDFKNNDYVDADFEVMGDEPQLEPYTDVIENDYVELQKQEQEEQMKNEARNAEVDNTLDDEEKQSFIQTITGGNTLGQEIKDRVGSAYRANKRFIDKERRYQLGDVDYQIDAEGNYLLDARGHKIPVRNEFIERRQNVKLELARERELARIREQYGGSGVSGYVQQLPGETAAQYKRRLAYTQQAGGKKPKGIIGQTTEAFNQGLGGFGGDGANKMARLTGQRSGMGVAMMSGAMTQPSGPTGFQTISRPSGGASKVQMLIGGARAQQQMEAPPVQQQVAYVQPAQFNPQQGVYSEASGKVVSYKRGKYNKRSQPQQVISYQG